MPLIIAARHLLTINKSLIYLHILLGRKSQTKLCYQRLVELAKRSHFAVDITVSNFESVSQNLELSQPILDFNSN